MRVTIQLAKMLTAASIVSIFVRASTEANYKVSKDDNCVAIIVIIFDNY